MADPVFVVTNDAGTINVTIDDADPITLEEAYEALRDARAAAEAADEEAEFAYAANNDPEDPDVTLVRTATGNHKVIIVNNDQAPINVYRLRRRLDRLEREAATALPLGI